jgi:hypothetical protein
MRYSLRFITQNFQYLWESGFNHYIEGEWQAAENYFKESLVNLIVKTKKQNYIEGYIDGPSLTLLNVIN